MLLVLQLNFLAGFSLLRAEDNLGGVRGDAGEEQPPRAGAEHPVHPVGAAVQYALALTSMIIYVSTLSLQKHF